MKKKKNLHFTKKEPVLYIMIKVNVISLTIFFVAYIPNKSIKPITYQTHHNLCDLTRLMLCEIIVFWGWKMGEMVLRLIMLCDLTIMLCEITRLMLR